MSRRKDYSRVDWAKTTETLASELGLSVRRVNELRARYAPHTSRRGPDDQVNWRSVDWQLSNGEDEDQ